MGVIVGGSSIMRVGSFGKGIVIVFTQIRTELVL